MLSRNAGQALAGVIFTAQSICLVQISKGSFGFCRNAVVAMCSTHPPWRMYDGREEAGQNTCCCQTVLPGCKSPLVGSSGTILASWWGSHRTLLGSILSHLLQPAPSLEELAEAWHYRCVPCLIRHGAAVSPWSAPPAAGLMALPAPCPQPPAGHQPLLCLPVWEKPGRGTSLAERC